MLARYTTRDGTQLLMLMLSFKFVLALDFCFAIHSVAIRSTHQSTKLNSSLSHKHVINVKVEGARKGEREGGREKEERGRQEYREGGKKEEAVGPKGGFAI